jgi:NAD(P)H-dependent FMN reductase
VTTRGVRVLLISGSLRAGSTNTALLRTAQELGGNRVTARLYEGLASLPHFNPDDDYDPLHPAVAELRAQIRDADAILFCTPEYAGDMPGSFKNLLDWTVGGVEIEGKPAAWINVSTSPGVAVGTHRALRTVLGYTGADIVDGACVHVPVARHAVDADGMVRDPGIRRRVTTVLRALADHTSVSRRPNPS